MVMSGILHANEKLNNYGNRTKKRTNRTNLKIT